MNEEEKELAEVGAKVMGWCKSTHGRTWIGKNGEYAGYMQPHTDFGVKWSPAQRVEQAFMVVAKMQEDKWEFRMFNLLSPETWNATFEKLRCGYHDGFGEIHQPALAILRAVKEAVKEKP